MGIEQIIKILECEKECAKHNKDNVCRYHCNECDFYINEQDAITAYILAISILKNVHGDRKIMSTTGAQNEFTIL